MSDNILLFPGQGSQYVGMGLDIYSKYSFAKSYYEIAINLLESDISNISFNGPEELLRQTQNTQPATFIHSICILKYLKEKGLTFNGTAGHSLGEFSALVAAEVLSFEDTLLLVKVRSREMAKAGEKQPGTMAAIIGATDEQMSRICDQKGIVVIANMNAPGQIVISGQLSSVSAAVETAKSIGVRRAVPLNVSAAFHSPLMKPAGSVLGEVIRRIHFRPPIVPVYQNVTAEPITDPEYLKINLLRQLESPVRWIETIHRMKDDGFKSFIEIGPGKVLQGLQKRIFPESDIISIDTVDQMEQYEI